jgi:hypothetical protein
MTRRVGAAWVWALLCVTSVSALAAKIDVTRFDDPDPSAASDGTSLGQAILLANSTLETDTMSTAGRRPARHAADRGLRHRRVRGSVRAA